MSRQRYRHGMAPLRGRYNSKSARSSQNSIRLSSAAARDSWALSPSVHPIASAIFNSPWMNNSFCADQSHYQLSHIIVLCTPIFDHQSDAAGAIGAPGR